MRHQHAFRKFSRTPSHRRAMFRNMVTALVLNDRIETTVQKAKELKRIADKLVTLGKTDTLHNRRQAMRYLMPIDKEAKGNALKWTAVHKLFVEIAPRYTERAGGYTRVLRTRVRPGDKAQMAFIGFVEGGAVATKAEAKPKRRTARKPIDAAGTTEATVESLTGTSTPE